MIKNKKLKIAIVGGGLDSAVGYLHYSALNMEQIFKVVSGCFSTKKKINISTAKKYNIEPNRLYDDINSLIKYEKNNIDFLLILLPTPLHFSVIKKSLTVGINVICEKSLATSLSEMKEIKKIKKKNNRVKIYPISNYLGYPMIQEIATLMSKNKSKIGKIIKVQIEMKQDTFLRAVNGKFSQPQNWRQKDLKIPMIYFDLGIHVFSIFTFITKLKLKKILCIQKNHGNVKNVKDDIDIYAVTADETSVHFNFGKCLLGHKNDLNIKIYGNKGSIFWNHKHSNEYIYNDVSGNSVNVDYANAIFEGNHKNIDYHKFKVGHPNGFLEAFANYYKQVYLDYFGNSNKKFESIFSLKTEEEFMKLCYNCLSSSKSQKWIKIKN
tara:strand:- start:22333 stop:23472 length:1140 start_codon:yes stop_codon:yes gene_type:complete